MRAVMSYAERSSSLCSVCATAWISTIFCGRCLVLWWSVALWIFPMSCPGERSQLIRIQTTVMVCRFEFAAHCPLRRRCDWSIQALRPVESGPDCVLKSCAQSPLGPTYCSTVGGGWFDRIHKYFEYQCRDLIRNEMISDQNPDQWLKQMEDAARCLERLECERMITNLKRVVRNQVDLYQIKLIEKKPQLLN